MEGGFRVVLDAEWRAVVVVVWVRLGEELGQISGLLEVWLQWNGRGRRDSDFSGRWREFGCSELSRFPCSLSDDQRYGGDEGWSLLSSWDGVKRGGFELPLAGAAADGRGAAGEWTGNKCPWRSH